jgi:hypothetical protein
MAEILPEGDVHSAILIKLAGLKKGTVVSTNAIVEDMEDSLLGQKPEGDLTRLVSEAAMLLGLVPVYDPARPRRGGFVRRSYLQPMPWVTAYARG